MNAHLVLEQVIEIQCMLAKSTDDFELPLTDPSLLKIASTPNTQFLLQSELRAIKSGLKYKEIQYEEYTYKGYVDKDDVGEGVAMRIKSDGYKDYGEWHLNNINGCTKVEFANGDSWWGEFKNGNMEGYVTRQGASGDRYIG
jgi:hypothetical protein